MPSITTNPSCIKADHASCTDLRRKHRVTMTLQPVTCIWASGDLAGELGKTLGHVEMTASSNEPRRKSRWLHRSWLRCMADSSYGGLDEIAACSSSDFIAEPSSTPCHRVDESAKARSDPGCGQGPDASLGPDCSGYDLDQVANDLVTLAKSYRHHRSSRRRLSKFDRSFLDRSTFHGSFL